MRARGFTLIELLVTLAILAVLAGTALPVAEITIQRQKEQDLRNGLHELRAAIDAYKRAFDDGRMVRGINSTGYPPSLEVLAEGVEDQKDPRHNKMYFLRRVPRDPMEPTASANPADSWARRAYASDAAEPKAGDDVYDVMSRSNRIGLNGLAYDKW